MTIKFSVQQDELPPLIFTVSGTAYSSLERKRAATVGLDGNPLFATVVEMVAFELSSGIVQDAIRKYPQAEVLDALTLAGQAQQAAEGVIAFAVMNSLVPEG
jgi:hypothetical protein